jgi:hypothetical protein
MKIKFMAGITRQDDYYLVELLIDELVKEMVDADCL